MNLINMKTGGRVSSSSTKDDELLNRYKDENENFREATTLEYELCGLLFDYGPASVATVMNQLIAEHERLNP